MKLYHYTGSEHVVGIRRDGIRGGSLAWPTSRGYARLAALQWLTDDPNWVQGWATRRLIHCDRTEARFKVAIPRSASDKLYRWRDFASHLGLSQEQIEWFSQEGGGGDQHWYVYTGDIPRTWLRGLELRPKKERLVGPDSTPKTLSRKDTD